MSEWREARNVIARARLEKALPAIFPKPVLVHAYRRGLTPPLPRLAVESYWAAHPLRAERLARALARRTGTVEGWSWQLASTASKGAPRSFRVPPAPFREEGRRFTPGQCCICGQPVFRFGWHSDLWREGRVNTRANWHACCVAAWRFWLAPHHHGALLRKLQSRRCAESGGRLLRSAEVDHKIPLYRVWRDHRDRPWPELLAYWGLPNLQVVNRAAHTGKSALEAADRAAAKALNQGDDLRSSIAVGL